ncbi:MAG: zinc ABC transporter substrate-binding protein [Gammaproteobacteria bacterium]|nr:zinc ABC transporter substrate-binding protein [Gammaproteobacteria bacterium]
MQLVQRHQPVHFTFLLLAFLVLFPASSMAKPKFTVCVSLLPQKYFVERIAGNYARVIVMVGPGQNEVTYEPKPSQLAQIEESVLYFLMNVPFEARWIKTFTQINPKLKIVPLPDSIVLRPMTEDIDSLGDNGIHGHRHDQGHAHVSMLDPHVWLNPRLVKHIAESMKTAFVKVDPENQQSYESGYQRFVAELDELDHYIHEQLDSISNRRFMVYHPSWGYFADEYGLQQIPIEVEGKQPGARTLSRLIEAAQQKQVKVIFVQQQFSDRDAKTIARQVGAKTITVDPLAEDYIENLKRVSRLFAEALQ